LKSELCERVIALLKSMRGVTVEFAPICL